MTDFFERCYFKQQKLESLKKEDKLKRYKSNDFPLFELLNWLNELLGMNVHYWEQNIYNGQTYEEEVAVRLGAWRIRAFCQGF